MLQTIKLAEALLRRKELQNKVDQLKAINVQGLFEVKMQRKQVSADYDDITAQVPKLLPEDVTAEYDYYASHLRKIDSVIQQANWTCEVKVDDNAMNNFKYENR